MELKNKKILVTGAGGFIGSHLTEALLATGCEVRAFVHYNSLNHWGWLDGINAGKGTKLEIISGDIRDTNGVFQAMKGCDVVFHLAALIAIPFSYNSPDSYVDTNIKGALNILQAAKNLEVSRIVMTSTSEVYGTAQYVPIDEKHPNKGQSPYSATKIAADKLAESFYCSFNTPVVIVRPFNTYGPRQSARAVIPSVAVQLLSGRYTINLGSVSPKRDFNYVTDTVNGFIALAECDEALGQEVNIASGEEYTIQTVAEMLIEEINPNAKLVYDTERVRPETSEVFRLKGDNSKIMALTRWNPQFSLHEGLSSTVAWLRKPGNLDRYKADIYNV
jgi:NAD dependent epimerase/dehydratase